MASFASTCIQRCTVSSLSLSADRPSANITYENEALSTRDDHIVLQRFAIKVCAMRIWNWPFASPKSQDRSDWA